MRDITRVGVDLAKSVIQVHAVDRADKLVINRALPRDKFIQWCAQLPANCVIAMEACSGAHHWARKLVAMGFSARIIPAQFVAPYRLAGKSAKNDANDAQAVCEAASRPHMNFVPIKSIEQQGILCVHRLRKSLVDQLTGCINRIRGMLAEFGVVLPQGAQVLRERLHEVLEDASCDISGMARLVIEQAYAQCLELDDHLAWCD